VEWLEGRLSGVVFRHELKRIGLNMKRRHFGLEREGVLPIWRVYGCPAEKSEPSK
jgi:hypothetical protein